MARRRMLAYQGPTAFKDENGESPEIVVLITYDTSGKGSANVKTGGMAQVWILLADMDPVAAVREGADVAICGDCPHRSKASGGTGACYVNVGQGPRATWMAHMDPSTVTPKGNKRQVTIPFDPSAFAGKRIRLGSYGDPAAVPIHIWQQILEHAEGHTAYTHAWRYADQAFAEFCMASADAPEEVAQATAAGYRSFIVTEDETPRGTVTCPASAEAGKKTTCEVCMQCSGAGSGRTANIAIRPHGATAKAFRPVSLPLSVV